MEEQPSQTETYIPPGSQDAPVIQPQVSGELQVLPSQQDDHVKEQLQTFWSDRLAEIEQATEFKAHSVPLARVKEIMKDEADVPRIAGEAPAVLAKAGEMFVQELTLRAWLHGEDDKSSRTLKKKDVTTAIARTEVFDFLVDIIGSSDEKPKEEEHAVGSPPPAAEEDGEDCYCWDDYSPPWSPDEPGGGGGNFPPNVTCDDPRYYTYIHDYYSL